MTKIQNGRRLIEKMCIYRQKRKTHIKQNKPTSLKIPIKGFNINS